MREYRDYSRSQVGVMKRSTRRLVETSFDDRTVVNGASYGATSIPTSKVSSS